jgi:hypothetical protein
MKGWTTLALVCLPGGCVIGLLFWIRRRWIAHLEQQVEDLRIAEGLIKKPVQRFTKNDDDLRVRTKLKRDAAARLKKRAHKVESGDSVSDILRVVNR